MTISQQRILYAAIECRERVVKLRSLRRTPRRRLRFTQYNVMSANYIEYVRDQQPPQKKSWIQKIWNRLHKKRVRFALNISHT